MLMLQENNRLLQENNRFASLSRRACVTFFIMAAVFIAGATAQAQTTYYSRASADWDINTTWHTTRTGGTPGDSGFPVAGDTAIIQATHTIDVDIAAAAAVVAVEDAASGGAAILDMQASGVLTVSVSVDVEDTQAVPGVFKFSAPSGTRPILRAAAASVNLDGPFTVTGSQGATIDQTSSFKFQLLSGGTLTSDSGPITISAPIENDGTITASSSLITLSGAVEPGSTGTFSANGGNMVFAADVENDGTIEAKGATDVTFSGTIAAGSSGMFKVTAAGSDMNFNLSAAVKITGGADFLVTGGRMFFQENVETDGGFKQTGGKTEVAAGKTFKATGAFP